MRIFLRAIFAIYLMVAPAWAETYPERTDRFLNDFADVLTLNQEAAIRAKLVEVHRNSDIEFTVLTINSLQDYGHGGKIEPYATTLFNTWGIGDGSRNDGVLMLVAVSDRVIRIEVGSGYGLDLNTPMQFIIDRTILPRFREGDMPEGISAGVSDVIGEVTGRDRRAREAAKRAEETVSVQPTIFERIPGWLYGALAAFLGAGGLLLRRWLRHRPRICPNDSSKMERMLEDWDDQHLQPGQITEERLKSVDYDVWKCMRCDHMTIEAYKGWFSRYSACRSCGNKTVESDSTILQSATRHSSGLKRIDYNCLHCQDTWSLRKTIPRITSSSSSSGGSSGGGSSSGGGASGSW